MTPGETSHADTCAAMKATAMLITARTLAIRRFRVISCRLIWSVSHVPARLTRRAARRAANCGAGTFITCAGYPQIVSVARGPRSIFAGMLAQPAKISASKIIGILRAARDMNSIMADSYLIRPITDEEYDGFRLVLRHAFHGGTGLESPPRRRQLFEIDRSLAAFDAARPDAGPVGATGIYTFGMTVPGGGLPPAGVTMVGVLPTHRRRGILRAIMRRQIADIAARGEEPIAALWASETPIYGRYGYGRATAHAHFRFGRGDGALDRRAPSDPALSLRLAQPAEGVSELAKVYDSLPAAQPRFLT